MTDSVLTTNRPLEACMSLVRQELGAFSVTPPPSSQLAPGSRRGRRLRFLRSRERSRRCRTRQGDVVHGHDPTDSLAALEQEIMSRTYTNEQRRNQWTEFVQICWTELNEHQLLFELEEGILYFRSRHPYLYDLMLRRTPAVYNMLVRSASAGATVRACLTRMVQAQSPLKRSEEAGALEPRDSRMTDGDMCSSLLSMVQENPAAYFCNDENLGEPCTSVPTPRYMCGTYPYSTSRCLPQYIATSYGSITACLSSHHTQAILTKRIFLWSKCGGRLLQDLRVWKH